MYTRNGTPSRTTRWRARRITFPDASKVKNPGITLSWTGRQLEGLPHIEHDQPDVYRGLLQRTIVDS